MSNAQISRIETRAKRVASKAAALGFTKNGSPMVIDQAREIVAAEDGHRNWQAARAAALRTEPAVHSTTLCSSLLTALEIAIGALDRMAEGEDFDDVVEDTGVSHRVTLAIVEAKKAGVEALPRPSESSAPGAPLGDVLHLSPEQCKEAEAQGWNLFEASGDVVVELQIQRDDELGLFENDDDAWLFVIKHAAADPESAAARALDLLRELSPAEYRRIELFDRESGQLLPKRPSSTVGHLVDLAEVATWVSVTDKEDFNAASSNRQQWFIDRFVLAHGEEDRFSTYLVCENWGHIFVGCTESMTRWVYRLGTKHEGVVAAQIKRSSRWDTLDRVARDDLKESIDDNGVPESYHISWVDEVKLAFELPYWAR